jgi:hypothetical protein
MTAWGRKGVRLKTRESMQCDRNLPTFCRDLLSAFSGFSFFTGVLTVFAEWMQSRRYLKKAVMFFRNVGKLQRHILSDCKLHSRRHVNRNLANVPHIDIIAKYSKIGSVRKKGTDTKWFTFIQAGFSQTWATGHQCRLRPYVISLWRLIAVYVVSCLMIPFNYLC